MTTSTSTTPTIAAPTTDGRYCITCAYLLTGLARERMCPECGTAVELSLREPTLANADPAYVRTIRSGLSLVLNGILLQIICITASLLDRHVLGTIGAARAVPAVEFIIQGAMLVVSLTVMVGYWKYTTPDPGQVAFETTKSARQIIRLAVLAQIVLSLISLGVQFMPTPATPTPSQSSALVGGLMVATLRFVLLLASLAVWTVLSVAVMRYTRWLATRVPDQFVIKRAKLYMWLVPLVSIAGTLLLVVGFLVALVFYWNLLDRMRKHLRSIEKTGQPAALKKVVMTT